MPVTGDEKILPSLGLAIPGFAAIAAIGAAVLHSAYGIEWSQLVIAASTLLAIQTAAWCGWFWARQHFKHTHDARPVVVITGLYGLFLIPTAMYFAWRWHLVSSYRALQDGIGITICIILSTIIVALMSRHWHPG